MLVKKYGKCLSNLWQIFGKKLLKMAIFLATLLFHYKIAIFSNIDFIVFCNSYFFHTFNTFDYDDVQGRKQKSIPPAGGVLGRFF